MIHLFKTKLKTLHKIIISGVIIILIICSWMLFRHFRYQSYIKAAEASEKEEQYVDAVIYYAMASHIKPKEETPYIKMADCYVDRSEMDQAMAILSAGKMQSKDLTQINKKMNEIQDFVDDDIDVNTIEIPEYTSSAQLKRKSQVDASIEEMRTYNGENGADNHWIFYYKGYYYYADLHTIYRTKNSKSDTEQLFHINNDSYLLSNVMIANNRIYFLLNQAGNSKLISIKTDGSDYTTLRDLGVVNPNSCTICNGWINYYNSLDYNEEKPFSRITLSGKKNLRSQTPTGNYNQMATLCFDRTDVYYANDKGIMKSNRKDIQKIAGGIEVNSKDEQCIIKLSSKELDNLQHIYKYGSILLYSFEIGKSESSDTTVYDWHAYDLDQQEKISLNLSKNASLSGFNALGDWIYYGEEVNQHWTLYRKNRFTNQTDKIKEISDTTDNHDFSICNDNLVILYEDEDYNVENIEFINLTTL